MKKPCTLQRIIRYLHTYQIKKKHIKQLELIAKPNGHNALVSLPPAGDPSAGMRLCQCFGIIITDIPGFNRTAITDSVKKTPLTVAATTLSHRLERDRDCPAAAIIEPEPKHGPTGPRARVGLNLPHLTSFPLPPPLRLSLRLPPSLPRSQCLRFFGLGGLQKLELDSRSEYESASEAPQLQ